MFHSSLSPSIVDEPSRHVHPSDYPSLETLSKNVIKEKQKFVRLELPKSVLMEMFKVNRIPWWNALLTLSV